MHDPGTCQQETNILMSPCGRRGSWEYMPRVWTGLAESTKCVDSVHYLTDTWFTNNSFSDTFSCHKTKSFAFVYFETVYCFPPLAVRRTFFWSGSCRNRLHKMRCWQPLGALAVLIFHVWVCFECRWIVFGCTGLSWHALEVVYVLCTVSKFVHVGQLNPNFSPWFLILKKVQKGR